MTAPEIEKELLDAARAMREAWEQNLTEPMERLGAAIDAAEELRQNRTTDPERYAKIVELAKPLCNDELEIDEGADLSEGDDNGTWIAAWVYVDFAGTDLDKEADHDEG